MAHLDSPKGFFPTPGDLENGHFGDQNQIQAQGIYIHKIIAGLSRWKWDFPLLRKIIPNIPDRITAGPSRWIPGCTIQQEKEFSTIPELQNPWIHQAAPAWSSIHRRGCSRFILGRDPILDELFVSLLPAWCHPNSTKWDLGMQAIGLWDGLSNYSWNICAFLAWEMKGGTQAPNKHRLIPKPGSSSTVNSIH